MTMNTSLNRVWHDVHKFPSPGVFVLARLINGTEVVAIRPDYVHSYNDDPQYKTPEGDPITGVAKWSVL